MKINKDVKKPSKIEVLSERESKKFIKMKREDKKRKNEFQNLIEKNWEKIDMEMDVGIENSNETKKDFLENSVFLDKTELRYIFREMEHYIENAYLDRNDIYKSRIETITGANSDDVGFFRTKDRIDNCIIIFQYLVFFGRDVAFPIIDKSIIKEHFSQFKDALTCFLGLLDENDVKMAIYREMSKNSSNENNIKEACDLMIQNMQKFIKKRINKTVQESVKNIFELFNIYREFILFWFEIKNYDIKRIRKSDIFAYYLLKHVQSLNYL